MAWCKLSPRSHGRIVERLEQRAAMHGEPVAGRWPKVAIAHVEHDAIGGEDAAEQAPDRRAKPPEALADTNLIQHSETDGLEDEAGAERLRALKPVEHGDALAF